MSSQRFPGKILVINLHSSQNAGDAALLEMTSRILHSTFPGGQIVLAMNQPDLNRDLDDDQVVRSFAAHFSLYQAHRRVRWRIRAMIWGVTVSLAAALWYRVRGQPPCWLPVSWGELLRAYMDADLVISCPGNIFATMGRLGMPFLISAFTVAYALVLDKRLYVMPQSIGPLKRTWERILVRHLYSNARLVFIREPVSFRLASEIGINPAKLQLIPDPAFALPQCSSAMAGDILKKHGVSREGPRIGVTVINRLLYHVSSEEWERYETAVAHALSSFIGRYGGCAVFFPQVIGPTEKEDDRVAARRIIARMTSPKQAVLIDAQWSPGMLKAMYGLMDAFVATRMHSAIFATSMGVPTLFIEYLHKMRGLAEMLGLEEWTLELSEVNETNLGAMLNRLWQRRSSVQCHLEHLVSDFAEQVNLTGQIVARDLYA